MTNQQWLTNDPEIARKLRAADKAYDKAINDARSRLALIDKIAALKLARQNLKDAYATIRRDLA